MTGQPDCLAQVRPWLGAAVALAMALRGYHYFSDPPVWHDEAALIINVLDKSYGEQLGPLYYSEAAPPLFLWAEKAVASCLGDGTYALRLLPFLATVAGLLGALAVARRVLPPAAVLVVALLFGFSDRLLWHGSEAKPYASDVLLAVGLLATFLREDDTPRALARLLLLYAALSPCLVFLSFPACFLLGGAALALLPAVLRARRGGVWAAYALFALALCGAFVLLYLGPVTAQKNERMFRCWADNFPDWQAGWSVPLLMVQRLSEVCRYACEPVGNVLAPLAIVGAVALWRAGRGRLVAAATLPGALAVVAWLLGQYPLGPARVSAFLAPAALLLVAAGVAPALAWLRRRSPLAVPALAVLLLVPAGNVAYRLAVPWDRLDSAAPAAFVHRHRRPSEPVVGALWEQAYYFRRLGPLFRPLDPQPTEPAGPSPTSTVGAGEDNRADGAVRRLWLLRPNEEGGGCCLARLSPAGAWVVEARREFRDVIVEYVVRREAATGGAAR
jgi:hypothetical protein